MPDQDTTINDGDPGHALLHRDVALEVNSLRARTAAAESAITSTQSSIGAKLTPDAGGVSRGQLNQASVYAGLRFTCRQTAAGQPYLQNGVTVTAANRVAGTFRDFEGVDNPITLGLTVDGDRVALFT